MLAAHARRRGSWIPRQRLDGSHVWEWRGRIRRGLRARQTARTRHGHDRDVRGAPGEELFTFHVELDVRVETVSEHGVGIAAFVAPHLQKLELFATSGEKLELCELEPAPPGEPTARCIEIGARSMNTWHHVAWLGTQPSETVSRSTVAIDCGPASEAFDADNHPFTADGHNFNFGVGADAGYRNAVAVILFDNVMRRIESVSENWPARSGCLGLSELEARTPAQRPAASLS